MAKSKGLPKSGGRKKGTPNKRTQELHKAFEDISFDVPGELVKIVLKLEPAKRADVLLALMPYLYPKRKEVSVKEDSEKHIIVRTSIGDGGMLNQEIIDCDKDAEVALQYLPDLYKENEQN